MSGQIPSTVVIVSRGRPEHLRRVITSLRLQTHTDFDVVVVADRTSGAGLVRLDLAENVELVTFEPANIAAARNAGIERSTGQIVAFCDDDAIPEPTWLDLLTQPFGDPDVVASGGYVKGRNGISFQWQAMSVDAAGVDYPIVIKDKKSRTLTSSDGRAVKTQGTNCAFRVAWLIAQGGFDENFKFYLDETDLNLRVLASGGKTAIVPEAQVQHGFAESALRTSNRVPTDLFEIGASQTYFLQKHADASIRDDAWIAFRGKQVQRLDGLRSRRLLSSSQCEALLQSLDKGHADGAARVQQSRILSPQKHARTLFPANGATDGVAIYGRAFRHRKLAAEAKKLAREGRAVTVFQLTVSTLFQSEKFTADGYWLRTGGLFGRAQRTEPLMQISSFRARVVREMTRLSAQRPVETLTFFSWRGKRLTVGMENHQLRKNRIEATNRVE